MKRLTLDKAWELCLKQWRWVIRQWRENNSEDINGLKGIWLNNNGFDSCDINSGCFFCEYGCQHRKHASACSKCPGRKIDKYFNCMDKEYDFEDEPEKFYKKLLELNRKRRKK